MMNYNPRHEKKLERARQAGLSPLDATMERLVDRLLVVGSVQVLAREVGDDAAARALHELTQAAPEELQPSWPLVLAYGRIQKSYETAERLGDSAEMRRSGEALAKLVTDRY